jgi:hypothetical protein
MGAAPSIDETKAVEGFRKFGFKSRGGGGTYVGNRGDSGGGGRSLDFSFFDEIDVPAGRSNSVKRTISSESPIYIPLVLNLSFLFVVGSRYLYYYKEKPSVEEFTKVFHQQKIDGSGTSKSE